MPTYIDITVPLTTDMLTWSTHEQFEAVTRETVHNDRRTRVTNLRLGTHTGTHVDSPFHFDVGDQTADQLSLDVLMGPARVIDLRGIVAITAENLAAADIAGADRVILKTDGSQWIRTGPFPKVPPHLTEGAAAVLIQQGIRLLGIDTLSVDHPESGAVHLALLNAGVIILETIDLSAVEPGDYHLTCLPLRLPYDGAPARAVLRTL